MKKKSKGYTREVKKDDTTTELSHIDQQKRMLLDTIDDVKPKKRVVEPIEIPEVLSVPRRQPIKIKLTAAPDFFEKNNSNVNSGLAGILSVSKRIKD